MINTDFSVEGLTLGGFSIVRIDGKSYGVCDESVWSLQKQIPGITPFPLQGPGDGTLRDQFDFEVDTDFNLDGEGFTSRAHHVRATLTESH